jgi:hypothetical protein
VFFAHLLLPELFLIFLNSKLDLLFFLLLSFEFEVLGFEVFQVLKADRVVGVFPVGHLLETLTFLLDFLLDLLLDLLLV